MAKGRSRGERHQFRAPGESGVSVATLAASVQEKREENSLGVAILIEEVDVSRRQTTISVLRIHVVQIMGDCQAIGARGRPNQSSVTS